MDEQFEFDGYDVLGRIGIGPNGDVWRARRHRDGTVVALKRVSGAGPDARDRLRRVTAVVGSSDPSGAHVLAAHDVRSDGADVVIVRDLASGGSLAALLTRRRLSAGEVVTLVAPLARVLAALHRRGVTHGAVSAHNVLFGADGRPVLADVGVGSAISGADAPTTADVCALAALGLAALETEGAVAIGSLLHAAAAPDADGDGEALAAALLAATRAEPIRLSPAGTAADVQTRARQRRRTRLLAVTGALALVGAAVAGGAEWGHRSGGHVSSLPALRPNSAAPSETAWQARPDRLDVVVRRLDEQRLRALADGDAAGLRRIYAPASLAGVTDRVTARVLARARIHAAGLQVDVRRVTVLDRSSRRATVRLVDAMSAYRLVRDDGGVISRRPARGPVAFVLTLVRHGGGWRVLTVS